MYKLVLEQLNCPNKKKYSVLEFNFPSLGNLTTVKIDNAFSILPLPEPEVMFSPEQMNNKVNKYEQI